MDLTETICWGKTEGLSVIEIGRAVSWKAGTVHDLLRKNHVIGHIEKRNRPLQLPQIDNMIIHALKDQKLSFERWTKGWGFNLDEAITHLSNSVNYTDSNSITIHTALNRDLPYEYFQIYSEEITSFHAPAYSITERYSYKTEWDTECNKYISKVIGRESDLDAPIGIDYKAHLAHDALLQALKQERQIKSLQKAVAMLAKSDCYQMFKKYFPSRY